MNLNMIWWRRWRLHEAAPPRRRRCGRTGVYAPRESVAGVSLDSLCDFKAYTIIGDGRLNLPELQVQVSSKRLYNSLVKCGVVSGEYAPGGEHTIDFTALPTVDIRQKFKSLDGVFATVAQGRALKSVLNALLKGRSEVYTDEQLASCSSV